MVCCIVFQCEIHLANTFKRKFSKWAPGADERFSPHTMVRTRTRTSLCRPTLDSNGGSNLNRRVYDDLSLQRPASAKPPNASLTRIPACVRLESSLVQNNSTRKLQLEHFLCSANWISGEKLVCTVDFFCEINFILSHWLVGRAFVSSEEMAGRLTLELIEKAGDL